MARDERNPRDSGARAPGLDPTTLTVDQLCDRALETNVPQVAIVEGVRTMGVSDVAMLELYANRRVVDGMCFTGKTMPDGRAVVLLQWNGERWIDVPL